MTKPRIVLLGGSGTLAGAIWEAANASGDNLVPLARAHCDVSDPAQVQAALSAHGADIVINAAGYLPHRCLADPIGAVQANTLGPHVVAQLCVLAGIRFVHISTDCVFGGRSLTPHPRTIDMLPNPSSLYGRLKLAGEPTAPKDDIAIVRTSFVGPGAGLWKWLEEQQRDAPLVPGWAQAWWSGGTSDVVARGILDIALSDYRGIAHLATLKPINKATLLRRLSERSGWNARRVISMPIGEDRSLHPTHVLPPLEWKS